MDTLINTTMVLGFISLIMSIIIDTFIQYYWINRFNRSWLLMIFRGQFLLRHRELKKMFIKQAQSGNLTYIKKFYYIGIVLISYFLGSGILLIIFQYLKFHKLRQ